MVFSSLALAAAAVSQMLAFSSVLRRKRSLATWCFFGGMLVLGTDSALAAVSLRATDPSQALRTLNLAFIGKSFVAAIWLVFSLVYSRGDFRQSVAGWRLPLAIIAVVPIAICIGFSSRLFELTPLGPLDEEPEIHLSAFGKAVNVALLVAVVWTLMNLEQTFRSAVGTMRWRIKFVVLGLAVIFGGRLYVSSQALLYSTYDVQWSGIESSALLIGCVLLGVAYGRTGLAEIDVYPSRAVLHSSLTLLIAGGYLVIVGVLANVAARLGGVERFQLQAFLVLVGMAGLAVLLLSDRLRQQMHRFVARHFARAQHDSVRIWASFSRGLAQVKEEEHLCAASARLISDTFEVLSVTMWILDEQGSKLVRRVSSAPEAPQSASIHSASEASDDVVKALRLRVSPFDVETLTETWADEFRRLNPTTFPNGGNRWCVPLRTAGRWVGALLLADRINGAEYSDEELQLLQCIAEQATSALLNLRLANEVARSRELEAFRMMSAFFVHDLKNTAALLNLMLKNLPVHFDDPAFREDALRGVSNMAQRIDATIGRLAALRQRPAPNCVKTDLNRIVSEVLDGVGRMPDVELIRDLRPLPTTLLDPDQIRSVVTNLVLNARDAVGSGGHISVRTDCVGDDVVVSVADDGCGMTAAFVKDSLFRPFQSTKNKGLGIGMFQSRMLVEAHGGAIRVDSEIGKGSTFRVSLPVRNGA